MESEPFEQRETDAAASEAGAIGGPGTDRDLPDAERPLAQAGEGESEGFERAEEELVEHASHGDQHAARRAIEDSDPRAEEPQEPDQGGEADRFLSSETEDDR